MSSKLRLVQQSEKKGISDDVQLQEQADFSVLFLSDRILKGLSKAGFKTPSPIQMKTIPAGCCGCDLLVQAKSGTGKTLVFTIIALETLDMKLFYPQVLILAPTREVAVQIQSVIQVVGSAFPNFTCGCFIGGESVDRNHSTYKCQIAVGTLGRVKYLIQAELLLLNFVKLFVMDEVDQLLHGKLKMDTDEIFNCLFEGKQVIATSATYPESLKKIIFQYLNQPYVTLLNPNDAALIGIIHYTTVVKSAMTKMAEYLKKRVVLEQILTGIKFCQCLVFCNAAERIEVLCKDIQKWGFSASHISSHEHQAHRSQVIEDFKNFKCKILVSSDVTSRGIDAANVDLVVSIDLAYNTETYLHRSGRAGRYGSVGTAVSIITDKEFRYLKEMETEGSFKTYKLPEPIPKDLIYNPTFGEYTIKEDMLENAANNVSNLENEDTATASDASKENIKEMASPEKHHHGNSTKDSMYVKSSLENNAEVACLGHQLRNSNKESTCGKISDEFKEYRMQNAGDEITEASRQSEIIDDSSDLKESYKPDFDCPNRATILFYERIKEARLKKLSNILQSDESLSTSGSELDKCSESNSVSSSIATSEAKNLSDMSQPYSNTVLRKIICVNKSSDSSSSTTESPNSESDSDSSCVATSEAQNYFKRNAEISSKSRETLKKYFISIANTNQKYNYKYSNDCCQFKDSKTTQQKGYSNYSNRGGMFCNRPKQDLSNTCTGYKSKCNSKAQHRNPTQSSFNYALPSIQKKVASSGYSCKGRFHFAHPDPSHSCTGCNATIPSGSHFMGNNCNYFVPLDQRQPACFDHNGCCRSQLQTNYCKQSHHQCFCCARESKCPNEQRNDYKHMVSLPRDTGAVRCTKSSVNCASSSYKLNNDQQRCTKNSGSIIPRNWSACAGNTASCAVSPGYHCQSPAAICYCCCHSNAVCSSSGLSFQDIFYNQWRSLQRCINPYL